MWENSMSREGSLFLIFTLERMEVTKLRADGSIPLLLLCVSLHVRSPRLMSTLNEAER